MKVDIIAAGRLRSGPLHDLYQTYHKRLQWSLSCIEIESKKKQAAAVQKEEHQKILDHIAPGAFVIALDERGKSLPSVALADRIRDIQNSGQSHIQFIIGGADGLSDDIRKRSDLLLSFGQQTWPHMLARVMLLEQIYRCQQILSGHPYHRE